MKINKSKTKDHELRCM